MIKNVICAVWENFAINPKHEHLVREAEAKGYIEKKVYYCGSLLMQLNYEVTDSGADLAGISREARTEEAL